MWRRVIAPNVRDPGRLTVFQLAGGAVVGMLVGWLLIELAGAGRSLAAVMASGLLGCGAVAVAIAAKLNPGGSLRRVPSQASRRAVVVGTGPEADRLVAAMLTEASARLVPVAVLDDDPASVGSIVGGLPVSGSTASLGAIAARAGAKAVVLATPQADSITIQSLSAQAVAAGCELLVLPPLDEIDHRVEVGHLRPPTAEDLFARDPVPFDRQLPAAEVTSRRVLLVGAAGSVGAPLARQILSLQPARLVLIDHDENALQSLRQSFGDDAFAEVHCELGDVRDRERVFELFLRHQPDVVFHAAALNCRQIPPCDPVEAIKTNTVGTKNLLDAAVHISVTTFVHISSAAAAEPTTVIGATMLSAERLTALAAAETGSRYLSVRTARIFDGRGSAFTVFRRQLAAGQPLALRHRDMTHLLLPGTEAARLVLLATAIGEPGQALVADAGYPVRLFDLAQHLVAEAPGEGRIEITGTEAEEIIHDVLFGANELGITGAHPRIVHTAVEVCDPCPALAEATGIPESDIRSMISAGSQLRLVKGTRSSSG